MPKSPSIIIKDEFIINRIFEIRDQKVMLDKDLAELYGVKPRRLREQVKRNEGRFPKNFIMQLTDQEGNNLVSQNAIPSRRVLGGALPYAFTEHGVLMVANILTSEQAIVASVRIIEIFIKQREALLLHKDIALLVDQIERKVIKHDEKIELLFAYMSKILEKEDQPRRRIGFRIKDEMES